MKKIGLIIMVVLAFFASVVFAEGSEITFNSIPWLSDEETVISMLTEKGFSKNTSLTELAEGNHMYFVAHEILGYQPTYDPSFNEISFTTTTEGKGRIGGYPVKSLIHTYAYDGTYKLISIKVNLIGADYDVLITKLTNVYGNAEVYSIDAEGVTTNLWRGDNNSAVILYTESGGYNYHLVYGRLDAIEILSECLGSVDPGDVSGL